MAHPRGTDEMMAAANGLYRWRVTWSLAGVVSHQSEIWARSWQRAHDKCVLTQEDADAGWAFVVDSKRIEEQQWAS